MNMLNADLINDVLDKFVLRKLKSGIAKKPESPMFRLYVNRGTDQLHVKITSYFNPKKDKCRRTVVKINFEYWTIIEYGVFTAPLEIDSFTYTVKVNENRIDKRDVKKIEIYLNHLTTMKF